MSATSPKNAPRLPLRALIRSMQDVFGTLSKAPVNYPEILVTGVPLLRKVYMINNPDMAQHILQKNYGNYTKGKGYEVLTYLLGKGLVTNEGENWHKQRTLIQPALHTEKDQRNSQLIYQPIVATMESKGRRNHQLYPRDGRVNH